MPEQITKAWKCKFCSRCFVNKGVAINHEAACKKNPERRHCATCVHGIMLKDARKLKESLTVESYIPGYEERAETYCGPWCAFHEQPMSKSPYFIECETDDNPYYEERPMPGTCFNYEYKGHFGWTPEDEYGGKHGKAEDHV